VSSDYNKGGTWAGAVEQLEKLHLVPVYIRSNGETGKGLEALRQKGALPWLNPDSVEAFDAALTIPAPSETPNQEQLSLVSAREPAPECTARSETPEEGAQVAPSSASVLTSPAEELFAKVRLLLETMDTPKTDVEVAAELNVSKSQAKDWLQQLVKEGVLEKFSKPVRYCSTKASGRLF
jgi:DNA processing protein